MKTPLWTPAEERKRDANITRFMHVVNQQFGLTLASYSDLYNWSVNSEVASRRSGLETPFSSGPSSHCSPNPKPSLSGVVASPS